MNDYIEASGGNYMAAEGGRNMVRILSVALLGILVLIVAASGQADQAARCTDPRDVLGKTWEWVGTITPVERITVSNPDHSTIRLAENDRLQARFDCNRGGEEYRISPGKLTFGLLISTRMACPPDLLDGPFMRDLQRVVSFFVQDGKL